MNKILNRLTSGTLFELIFSLYIHFMLFLMIAICYLMAIIASPFDRLLQARGQSVNMVIQRLSRIYVFFSTIKVVAKGRENLIGQGPCIIVSNHQSMIDYIVLLAAIAPKQFRFLTKNEMLRWPLVGRIIQLGQHGAVDRSNPRQSFRALQNGIENVGKGDSFIIFPEGTRSVDGSISEFKEGAFYLAIKAGVPVIPVKISGTRDVYDSRKSLFVRRSIISISVGIAEQTTNMTEDNIGELALRLESRIKAMS
jgi:1-acyl-sn-glycerol-3-phosphate acyltransferase